MAGISLFSVGPGYFVFSDGWLGVGKLFIKNKEKQEERSWREIISWLLTASHLEVLHRWIENRRLLEYCINKSALALGRMK